MSELDEVKAAIRPNTKMFFIETPTNPMMKVADIHALSEIAKGIGALTVVDNTFLTPYFQKPLQLGADIVTHSSTKYLGGHNDRITRRSQKRSMFTLNPMAVSLHRLTAG